MNKLRILVSISSLSASLALSGCGSDADGGGEAIEPRRDASTPSPPAEDAGGISAMDAGPRDPITDFINGLLGDGGLSGISGLLGDGGLSGISGLLGDGGFSSFLDGGFDPALICARAPQFCPDAGPRGRDAGADAGDGGRDGSAPDASEPDAADGSSEAGSNTDSSTGAEGGA